MVFKGQYLWEILQWKIIWNKQKFVLLHTNYSVLLSVLLRCTEFKGVSLWKLWVPWNYVHCNLLHSSAYVRKFLISGAASIFSPIYPVANTWSVLQSRLWCSSALAVERSSAWHRSAWVWAIRFCTVAPARGTPSALSMPCTPSGWAPSKGSPSHLTECDSSHRK